MPSVLVSGHTGFIGRQVTSDLEVNGLKVMPVSRGTGIDLGIPGSLERVTRPDIIVHLAGRSGVTESWEDPGGYIRDNVLPAITVFDQARSWNVPVILMSSYMYGVPRSSMVDESHPISCNNPYAHAKRLVEVAAEAYHRDFGIPMAVLRPFTLYGPGQGSESLGGLVLDQVMNADEIVINDLNPRRDFMHVADLASAVTKIASRPPDRWAVYNVGTGESHSVADFIETAQTQAGTAKPVVSRDVSRPNEIADCRADTSRLRNDYGWSPRYSLAEGLAETLKETA